MESVTCLRCHWPNAQLIDTGVMAIGDSPGPNAPGPPGSTPLHHDGLTPSGPGLCGLPTSRVLGNSEALERKKRAERSSPALQQYVILDLDYR